MLRTDVGIPQGEALQSAPTEVVKFVLLAIR